MSLKTQIYKLTKFAEGDIYSARADQERFKTIDNQLYRLSNDLCQDGIIDGLELINYIFPTVKVSEGSALINGFFVNIFNNYYYDLEENSVIYGYLVRKPGIVGSVGPRSDIKTITYSDPLPPSTPTLISIITLPEEITIEWSTSSAIDFKEYRIDKSEDNAIFTTLATQTIISYDDTNVVENTTYYYRIYAIDYSGYLSIPLSLTITTPISAALPPDPTNIKLYRSYDSVNVVWQPNPSMDEGKIASYGIEYMEVYSDLSPVVGSSTTITVNKNYFFARINDLKIAQKYSFRVFTTDTLGRESLGITQYVDTQPNVAPLDPSFVAYTSEEASDGVKINLVWGNSIHSELSSLGFWDLDYWTSTFWASSFWNSPTTVITPYRYKIYITVGSNTESQGIDVPIGDLEYSVSIYTNDLVNYYPIPEDTIVTFRITALDLDGNESNGYYLSFKTLKYTPPNKLISSSAYFDSTNSQIVANWKYGSDCASIHLLITDTTTSTIILNENIGLSRKYVLTPITLGDEYRLEIFPIGYNSVSGNPDTLTIKTLEENTSGEQIELDYPAMPPQIAFKSGDRNIFLYWEKSTTSYVNGYKIYRKEGQVTFDYSDWAYLDTVNQDTLTYTDYGLNNNLIYSYYITTLDIYGRESQHLNNGEINLNYIEAFAKDNSILTEPINVTAVLDPITHSVNIAWTSLAEEFDCFAVWRSIGNLHSWTKITSVDKTVTTYTDMGFPLIDQTIYYYGVEKVVNDAEVRFQLTQDQPENSLYIGKITTTTTNMTFDTTEVKTAKNLQSTIDDYAGIYLYKHHHIQDINQLNLTGTEKLQTVAADRIQLNENIIVDDWTTTDGKVWTTKEIDITGSSYFVTVEDRFPSTFYTIDTTNVQLVFAEAIASQEQITNGTLPVVKLEIFGVSEVQNILDDFRFDNIHAKQIAFGNFNKEQLPAINHEGRIRDNLTPKTFKLERYNDHTFIVPQNNTDTSKNFGDAVTFFSVVENNGAIEKISSFDYYSDGLQVIFRDPSYDTSTLFNINPGSFSRVTSSVSYQGAKSDNISFGFVDNLPYRWVKISTNSTPIIPNPVINLTKRLRFKLLLTTGSFYLTLGIREISNLDLAVGSNGGIIGPVEWVGVDNVLTDWYGNNVPVGIHITSNDNWQVLDFDLQNLKVENYSDGNGILSKGLGVLDHLAITCDSEYSGPVNFYIDDLEQISDVLVAGTSQGLLVSNDFGSTWNLSRYTSTPVHKFFKSN